MQEIKDDTNRWRDIPCSWARRISIVKMTIISNAIYRFNVILIKLPMAFFKELKQKISQFSFLTPWTVAHQGPLSMGLSRQEYWNGLPCPPPGDVPDLEIKLTSLMSPSLAGGFFTPSATWEAHRES